MSVYVDPLMGCVPNPRWKWDKSCHLVADTLQELHAFAARLGLKRAWFQDFRRGAEPGQLLGVQHYDLTEGKRAAAVAMGAVEIDRVRMVELMREQRAREAMAEATGSLF